MSIAAPDTDEERATAKLLETGFDAGWADACEAMAQMIEGYSAGQILMAAGEMSAQEMRTVKAVQRWWASAIRHRSNGT